MKRHSRTGSSGRVPSVRLLVRFGDALLARPVGRGSAAEAVALPAQRAFPHRLVELLAARASRNCTEAEPPCCCPGQNAA